MKTSTGFQSKALALLLATLAFSGRSMAEITPGAGYGVETFYTHATSDSIISFDQDGAGNTYYLTTPGFGVDVWQTNGGGATNIYMNTNRFPGDNVVVIGDYVFFNESDASFPFAQRIQSYGPLSGSATVTEASTASNYSLARYNGALYITATPTSPQPPEEPNYANEIFRSTVGSGGELETPVSLGFTEGFSGPLTFDSEGNLYYAAGFGDFNIYKWSAAEVAQSSSFPLRQDGHLWLDYTGWYDVAGATAIVFDADGDLMVSLTNFSGPSLLVEFAVTPAGAYSGTSSTVLEETGRLGGLRNIGGELYVSAENKIYHVVPEPSSLLLALGGTSLVLARRRRR